MALPMISRGRILGVLNAESQEVDAFSPQDQKIFTVLANSTALAIDNAILYQKTEELTIVDELTGAFNYRYFTQKLADEIRRATRYAQTLSLIMVDIDWFKKCNDSYGHPFGNLVLKSLSDLIRHSIRDVDMLFRYGGEEFMVILPQTDKEQAKTIAERIRSQVERSEFVDPEKSFRTKITVSVGIACFPEDGKTQPDLIGKVDHALYQAKGWGKNLVSTV